MFGRFFVFLFGFGLSVIGATFLILYLNLMTVGYSFTEYVNFIIRRPELYYLIIGLLIITITIMWKEDKKYELHLWYFS